VASEWERHARAVRWALWGFSALLLFGGLGGAVVATAASVRIDPSLVLNWVAIIESPTLAAVLASTVGSPGRWLAKGYWRGLEDGGGEVRPLRR
jgi:hypothetical protein